MKRKTGMLIFVCALALSACAEKTTEENAEQSSGVIGMEQTDEAAKLPEEVSQETHVLSLPIGDNTVDVAVNSRLSLHECPGLFLNSRGELVQIDEVRWFHVMADQEDEEYFFTFTKEDMTAKLQNSVFEWMSIPKEMLPVVGLYGEAVMLDYIGEDADHYYLAQTHVGGSMMIASIIVDGEANEFGNWGRGYASVALPKGYYDLSGDAASLKEAVTGMVTPFCMSSLTTINSPQFLYEADYYSEDPYKATILDGAWTADVFWAKEQLLEHAGDYAYQEDQVRALMEERQSRNEASDYHGNDMTDLTADESAVVDARAQIYARLKAYGHEVSLDKIIVLLGKSDETEDAPLCNVWFEENGEWVWYDGYYQNFYQDIAPTVNYVGKAG